MAFFNATQRELAAGRGVFFARLVLLDIAGSARHLWTGFGDLPIGGDTYKGDGSLVAISDIPVDQNVDAGNVTLTLSGVAEWARDLVRDKTLCVGRQAFIWGQFFDESLARADSAFRLFDGTMDLPRYSATGAGQRSIELPIEGDNIDRNRAAFAYFSDRDQQARFAGDRGLEFIAELGNKKVRWPP